MKTSSSKTTKKMKKRSRKTTKWDLFRRQVRRDNPGYSLGLVSRVAKLIYAASKKLGKCSYGEAVDAIESGRYDHHAAMGAAAGNDLKNLPTPFICTYSDEEDLEPANVEFTAREVINMISDDEKDDSDIPLPRRKRKKKKKTPVPSSSLTAATPAPAMPPGLEVGKKILEIPPNFGFVPALGDNIHFNSNGAYKQGMIIAVQSCDQEYGMYKLTLSLQFENPIEYLFRGACRSDHLVIEREQGEMVDKIARDAAAAAAAAAEPESEEEEEEKETKDMKRDCCICGVESFTFKIPERTAVSYWRLQQQLREGPGGVICPENDYHYTCSECFTSQVSSEANGDIGTAGEIHCAGCRTIGHQGASLTAGEPFAKAYVLDSLESGCKEAEMYMAAIAGKNEVKEEDMTKQVQKLLKSGHLGEEALMCIAQIQAQAKKEKRGKEEAEAKAKEEEPTSEVDKAVDRVKGFISCSKANCAICPGGCGNTFFLEGQNSECMAVHCPFCPGYFCLYCSEKFTYDQDIVGQGRPKEARDQCSGRAHRHVRNCRYNSCFGDYFTKDKTTWEESVRNLASKQCYAFLRSLDDKVMKEVVAKVDMESMPELKQQVEVGGEYIEWFQNKMLNVIGRQKAVAEATKQKEDGSCPACTFIQAPGKYSCDACGMRFGYGGTDAAGYGIVVPGGQGL